MYFFQIWQFIAHATEPVAGSILGLLTATILKFATYGFIRVVLSLFPYYTTKIVYKNPIISYYNFNLFFFRNYKTSWYKITVAYSLLRPSSFRIRSFSNTIQGIEVAILLSLAHIILYLI
jgi:NADH-ubiquinone oxidoreductase chain 4